MTPADLPGRRRVPPDAQQKNSCGPSGVGSWRKKEELIAAGGQTAGRIWLVERSSRFSHWDLPRERKERGRTDLQANGPGGHPGDLLPKTPGICLHTWTCPELICRRAGEGPAHEEAGKEGTGELPGREFLPHLEGHSLESFPGLLRGKIKNSICDPVFPETGFDEVAHVGIREGRIARISRQPLSGARQIDARGLVVAPGFIDLHSHGQTPENYRLKALDGVTTALELEIGVPDIRTFLQERQGQALIHYGASISHPAARARVFGTPLAPGTLLPLSGPATNDPASPEQRRQMQELLQAGLEEGALGIGMGIAYTLGATRLEVVEMFRLAASLQRPVFVHVRSAGRLEPGSSVEAVLEAIAAAAVTGASLHIVHINSSGLRDALDCLRLIEGARGLDVTTEAYPYGAGMTAVNSALFNPGWREKLGIDYGDLQRVDTGERLDRETFERLHAQSEPTMVLLFLNPPEIVDAVIAHPLAMVASDGLLEEGKGHPRSAGTFARILRYYVREQGRLTLLEALRKMTLLPALRLERSTPLARRKGRLPEGADADLVIFDPSAVQDQATYEAPGRPSFGFQFVLVAGTPVVEEGKIVEGVLPGRPLLGESLDGAR